MSTIRKTGHYLLKRDLACDKQRRYISPEELLDIVKHSTDLDSDLVDGKHASSFCNRNHNHDDIYYTKSTIDSSCVNKHDTCISRIRNTKTKTRRLSIGQYLIKSSSSMLQVIHKHDANVQLLLGNYAVWTSYNDGPHSGLNADTVDGLHFEDIKTNIEDAVSRSSRIVSQPIIHGPVVAKYDSCITLTASGSRTAFATDHTNISYEWILPTGARVLGRTITYRLPNASHINERLPFKCRAIDSLGNRSKYSKFIVQIGRVTPPVISDAEFSTPPPHKSGNSYELTITAHTDTNARYIVSCSDPNVTIVQHNLHPNKFRVSYPVYSEDTRITFNIIVIANKMTTTYSTSIDVLANKAPVIIGVAWSPGTQFFQGQMYTMIINASDPDHDNLIYNVTCSNDDVIIQQRDVCPNKFDIKFPTFNETEVSILFNIEVSDGYTSSHVQELCVVTKRTHIRINRIIWSSPPPHFARKHYSVKIDATSPTSQILYNVECDSDAVVITQDRANTNVFHIQYKGISAQTDVLFTFTAYDANNSTNYSTYVTVKP